MTQPVETVTANVTLNLNDLARALVRELGASGVQSFVFQLVSLRNNAQLDRELADELGTPLTPAPAVVPDELLEAVVRHLHPGYDRAAPVERSDARTAVLNALYTAAAVFERPREGGAPWTS